MRYGADGYALYWYCLELIAGKVDAKNITFELEHDAEILGYTLKIDSVRVEEIMRYLISLGLFEADAGGRVTCLKLATRLDTYTQRSPQMKAIVDQLEAPKLFEHSSNTLRTDFEQCANSVLLRLDKNRLDKRKGGRFTPPTLPAVDNYAKEKGYTIDAEAFLAFYESKGWMIGKNKMKCWKSAVTTWAKREKREKTTRSDNAAIEKAGKELGITPKPGESWDQYRARIRAAQR